MQSWKRTDLDEHLRRLRADRDAIERAGNRPPDYVLMAIRAVEDELERRDRMPAC